MEIQDGFIVGIFNYCDSWCAACAFTSRCRVFADIAEAEATLDPNLRPIAEAPPLPQDIPPPPPAWMQDLIDDMNELARSPLTDDDLEWMRPKIPPAHELVHRRAEAYRDSVHTWLRTHEAFAVADPADPRAVVGWFHTLIPVKIVRALRGLADESAEHGDFPADHDGSAKVALLGIERSHAGWLQIVEREMTTWTDVEPFVQDLVWLGEELERVFPAARAFVRPGFDEPDDVARLRADNCQ